MKMRKGQLARWRRTLDWLRLKSEGEKPRCQIQIPAENAKEKELSIVPTAAEKEPSRATSAGAVTGKGDYDVQSVGALVATLSADAELVALGRVHVETNRTRERSMMRPPYNADKDTDHWQLAKEAAGAWQAWCAALSDRCIKTGDRRRLAQALVPEGTGEGVGDD